MDHAVNVRVGLKDFVEGGFIGNIELVELRPLPTDELYPIENLLGRIVEIVGDNDLVICFEKR